MGTLARQVSTSQSSDIHGGHNPDQTARLLALERAWYVEQKTAEPHDNLLHLSKSSSSGTHLKGTILLVLSRNKRPPNHHKYVAPSVLPKDVVVRVLWRVLNTLPQPTHPNSHIFFMPGWSWRGLNTGDIFHQLLRAPAVQHWKSLTQPPTGSPSVRRPR
ncbi:hypothetical protein PIB30_034420 [Stylosanthes scabra]|uniref:Uncharacterized protein n=1 Tax=Stylosanthes scabra TaxID=79078 RepID=A0ABU6QCQ4_9FABA|nr:hypothetical protein [Stylosanthes scabra]